MPAMLGSQARMTSGVGSLAEIRIPYPWTQNRNANPGDGKAYTADYTRRTAMKIEVFNYAWTYSDGSKEVEEEAEVSPHKVTRKYFEDRKLRSKGLEYQIIEGSKDLVDASMVIDGIYYPDVFSHK
jgi:hypothetical protein